MNYFHFRIDYFRQTHIFGHVEKLVDFRINQRRVVTDQ
jgi:hypothetical protein